MQKSVTVTEKLQGMICLIQYSK